MKLRLDYATAPHAARPWVWLLLAATVLAAGVSGWQWTQLRAEREGLALRLQARSATVQSPAAAVPVPVEKKAAMKQQVVQANAVLAELGYPWPALFTQLEKSAGKEVALLAIRPDAAKGRVRIVGEVRHLADALEYVRRLTMVGGMAEVVLEQHEVVETDPQKPVRFALSARWRS